MAVSGEAGQPHPDSGTPPGRRAEPALRFGICGLGFIGRTHLDRLGRNPRARVVAICDQDAARRRPGEVRGNIAVGGDASSSEVLTAVAGYAETARLIEDPSVDAVVVALPTSQHAEVTVAALEAGKHVLCEKPMALTVADCDRMIRAARASRRTLMVAQCIRFWPQYRMIRRLVAEGCIGAMRFAILRRISSPPMYSAHNWLLDEGQSGGALLDLHVHDVDFVHSTFGLPRRIAASGSRGPSGGFDHIAAMYGYDDGRYVVLEGGWTYASPWPFEMSITVAGEQGTLTWSSSADQAVQRFSGGAQESLLCPGDAYQNEDDYFIACVLAGRAVEECLPGSTRTSIALAWLERRVIETGEPCEISDRLRAHWTRAGL